MKLKLRNWNFIRLLRLFIGIAGTLQGFMLKEFAISLVGFLLVYMALADAGCCGANACRVEVKEVRQPHKEIEHDEVVP